MMERERLETFWKLESEGRKFSLKFKFYLNNYHTSHLSMELSINVSLSQEITDLAVKALHDGDGQEEEEDRRVL